MIEYNYFQLDNGLKVYVHEDTSTPLAVLNILYNVGSKDEEESKTGFAHLFEHLMFGGSKNVQNFDEPLQAVGGESNAFTSDDITNYYCTLPAKNIETAFWLESDRMLGLSFDPKVLEVQQSVVIEEFKQRYLNQPYGDIWLKFRPLIYQKHSYKWPTIGKEISHIEKATMDDVKGFFYKYYIPNNAVLVVGGNVKTEEVKKLCKKWFEPIPSGANYSRKLPIEPLQNEKRTMDTSSNVPLSAIYKAYHMEGRFEEGYHVSDLISDILGRGKSSILYQKLVQKFKMFNSINAYVMGLVEPGILVIQGELNKGIDMKEAERAIQNEIDELITNGVKEEELNKVKNQAITTQVFSEIELLNRVMELAFFANSQKESELNGEIEKIKRITLDKLNLKSDLLLSENNCSTLYYHANN